MSAFASWRRGSTPIPPGGDGPHVTAARRGLEAERQRLAEDVAERTWDLGGLVYEMAVRDHFRLDVVSRRAAELQRVDAQLSEVERLVADHEGIAGHCRFCGSPHGRSAEFCWNCGERLLVRQVPDTIDGSSFSHAADAPMPYVDPEPTAFEDAGPGRADAPTREYSAITEISPLPTPDAGTPGPGDAFVDPERTEDPERRGRPG